MTETPTSDWVAAYVEAGPEPRDQSVHNTLKELHRALEPDSTDSIVVESFHDPATDGWRLVMHRIPYVAPEPDTAEEIAARRLAVLEEALADPEGRALAEEILRRKKLAEYRKDAGLDADDDHGPAGPPAPLLDLPGSERLRQNRERGLTRGDGPALA
ncbi:hypothetical protein SEA_ALTADENA_56 [Arthrobacter phage Altadena]|uniref:Uncharacterized protein n=1 Tax=Arthrobacter phage Altadena TaxID=3059064 RepID=A0AA96KK11_9CAUD|nr:hypothetical protein SEA_ALTADENA_56 [Arthrobacter phage Altadena]